MRFFVSPVFAFLWITTNSWAAQDLTGFRAELQGGVSLGPGASVLRTDSCMTVAASYQFKSGLGLGLSGDAVDCHVLPRNELSGLGMAVTASWEGRFGAWGLLDGLVYRLGAGVGEVEISSEALLGRKSSGNFLFWDAGLHLDTSSAFRPFLGLRRTQGSQLPQSWDAMALQLGVIWLLDAEVSDPEPRKEPQKSPLPAQEIPVAQVESVPEPKLPVPQLPDSPQSSGLLLRFSTVAQSVAPVPFPLDSCGDLGLGYRFGSGLSLVLSTQSFEPVDRQLPGPCRIRVSRLPTGESLREVTALNMTGIEYTHPISWFESVPMGLTLSGHVGSTALKVDTASLDLVGQERGLGMVSFGADLELTLDSWIRPVLGVKQVRSVGAGIRLGGTYPMLGVLFVF